MQRSKKRAQASEPRRPEEQRAWAESRGGSPGAWPVVMGRAARPGTARGGCGRECASGLAVGHGQRHHDQDLSPGGDLSRTRTEAQSRPGEELLDETYLGVVLGRRVGARGCPRETEPDLSMGQDPSQPCQEGQAAAEVPGGGSRRGSQHRGHHRCLCLCHPLSRPTNHKTQGSRQVSESVLGSQCPRLSSQGSICTCPAASMHHWTARCPHRPRVCDIWEGVQHQMWTLHRVT